MERKIIFRNTFNFSCHKTFSSTKKLNSINIWTDYTIRKQTYEQLVEKYECSIKTIQRYIEKSPKAKYRNVRSAYASLKYYIDFIFTYEEYSEIKYRKYNK